MRNETDEVLQLSQEVRNSFHQEVPYMNPVGSISVDLRLMSFLFSVLYSLLIFPVFVCMFSNVGQFWASFYKADLSDNHNGLRSILFLTLAASLGLPIIVWHVFKPLFKSHISEALLPRLIFFPIAMLNVGLIIIGMLFSYDNSVWSTVNHIGFPYGNFQDFFHILYLSRTDQLAEVTSIGYFPFSLLIGRLCSLPLTGWNQSFEHNPVYYGVYATLIVTWIYAAYVQVKSYYLNKVDVFSYLLLLIASYPFFLEFERGNFVVFSFIFLSFALMNKSRSWLFALFISCFMSLKVLNCIILIPALIHNPKNTIKKIIPMFLLMNGVVFLVLTQGFGLALDYSSLISVVIGGKVGFPDAHQLVAHSTLYSLYRSLAMMFFLGNRQFDVLAMSLFTYVGTLFGVCGLYLLRRRTFEVMTLYLFCILFAFHHCSTDMNLILLFPLVISVIYAEERNFVLNTVPLLFFVFLFTHQFMLFSIRETIPYFVSLKHIMTVISLLSFIILTLYHSKNGKITQNIQQI